MATIYLVSVCAAFVLLVYFAWRRYIWAADDAHDEQADTCEYSLSDVFDQHHLINAPHQKGIQWLTDVFSRSAKEFPDHTALQIPHTGESFTYAELDQRAEKIAASISHYLDGPDQVVAVAMSQDNWQIVASHLGVLKAGGTMMFLDTSLPEALVTHMLNDANPVVILTRGEKAFRDLPTLDVLDLPDDITPRQQPHWLDDPTQRLATIFYTSGTTGMPKGVECAHAGYVNLAQTYADYFDLLPGMDATSLTSSLGYDGSISEMYSAWVSGCSVVLLTKEQVRSGPDLIPILLEAEVTMLFCPPVLLTTLTPNPEMDLPYPICRYIVPAGEAFPSALVEPWTRGRRQIINTYGPTEASTDTSRQSLRPGEPITIGSPFANVIYVILEIDQLDPLPHGEVGELCIGGVHIARGYRNLPEQTAQKFITHPKFGRLYRTGDRCRIDIKSQQVQFLGRTDTQLKVRGHRVETQPVEDILQTQFSEIEAAVLDYQNQELVAFVSAPTIGQGKIKDFAAAPSDWSEQVTAILAKQLPDPSVPSRIFLVENFVMKPVSGKIDRTCLPNLSHLLGKKNAIDDEGDQNLSTVGQGKIGSDASEEELDPDCAEILDICKSIFETSLGPDDKFSDSGGHSIAIARLAQHLQAAGWIVSVRDLLSEYNTVRKVASRPKQSQQATKSVAASIASDKITSERDEVAAKVLSVRHFTTLQILFGCFLYSPGIISFFAIFGFVEFGTFFTSADIWAFIIVGFYLYVLGLLAPFAILIWVMIVKLLMGGHVYKNNVTPGIYPKWSRMHLRIWCISRMEAMVLMSLGIMFRSAPLMAFVLRQLGMNVGKNLQCAHDAPLSGPLDLITIEDNVAIQTGAYVQTTRWSGQYLHVGPILLESGCKIGMRSGVANNVTVGKDSWVTPFTPILKDVGPNEMWSGAPARLVGGFTKLKRTSEACHYGNPIWLLETLNILMQVVIFLVLNVVPAATILWLAREVIPAGEAQLSVASVSTTLSSGNTGLPANYFMVTPLYTIATYLTLYAFFTTFCTVIVTSLLSSLFIRFTAVQPGIYPTRGLKGALLLFRMKAMNSIQGTWTWTITGQYFRALAGLRFPRVGASECDVMFNLVPEAATADSQVFWSNGSFTNMLDYGAEHIKLRRLDMPRNFFSGNNCVVEHGNLPSNFLLGVSTPGSDIEFRRQMHSRLGEPLTVAGNPPVQFASASFEAENDSHSKPSFWLFLTRVTLNDVFSIGILRVTEGLIFTIYYLLLLRMGGQSIASAFGALLLTEVSLIFLSVTVKKLLVGSDWGADHSTPFWSWRHFAYFFAQDCFFVWCKGPLGFFAGTVLSNPILRWMGCKIGHSTLVTKPMQCFDWNAVSIGNNCVVNGFLQYHSFENMMLKVKKTRIEDNCTITFGATLMGGAVIDPDTTLMPLSMVLKEMKMYTGIYEGSPAEPAGQSDILQTCTDQNQELEGGMLPTEKENQTA